jgi:hypothetical protein
MARRYGEKSKTVRTWKKLSKMNVAELNEFKDHLEEHKQYNSKVYDHVIQKLSLI